MTTAEELADRRSAAWWFGRHPRAAAVLAALPDLERVAGGTDDPQVRGNAIVSVAAVAAAHGRPVPRVVLDALYDDDLRPYASVLGLPSFKPFPPDAVKALVKYATSGKTEHREDGLFLLAHLAPKEPEALKVLRAATSDREFWVRHAAHLSLFNATGKFDDFFRYVLRFQAEYTDLPELKKDAAEEETRERVKWNLTLIGLAMRLAEWAEDRPGEMRDAIVKGLADEDPKVRRSAAAMVGRFAAALATKPPEPPAGTPGFPELDVPGFTPPRRIDPKKQRDGMAVVVTAPGLRDRLKELADKDPDRKVRGEAGLAASRLEQMEKKER
jgi:hypothetical protein